jgi:hypothetical protein
MNWRNGIHILKNDKMKKIILLLITVVILISPYIYFNLEIVQAAPSKNYYVANDGDDSNDGLSQDTPWRTIGKVNSELNGGVINIGDDIYFKKGDIFDDANLRIRLGGTGSDKMIIGAYGSGDRPAFTGCSIYTTTAVGDITIENLQVSDTGSETAVAFNKNGNIFNVTVKNLLAFNANNGIFIRYVDNYRIENCIVHDVTNGAITVYGSATNKATNGYIANCTMYNVTNNDGISLHQDANNYNIGANHLIFNCTGYNCHEQAFDISCTSTGGLTENIAIIDCKAYNNDDGSYSIGGVVNLTIDNFYSYDENAEGLVTLNGDTNVIIRNSVIRTWATKGLVLESISSNRIVKDVTVYNNDFIFDDGTYTIDIVSNVENIRFKNNIMTSLDNTAPNLACIYRGSLTPSNTNSIWSNNIWWRGDGGAEHDKWWAWDGLQYDFEAWTALSEVSNELQQNPDIIDPANNNYNLDNDSPCIDAGTWLTNTDGSGTGTTITVDEANYFFDGYGIDEIPGDLIFIGSNKNLRVVDVNYVTETITVDRSISWNAGDDVSLMSYNGNGPDIGARESFYFGPEITNIINTESNPLDTNPSYGWINITANIEGISEVSSTMLIVNCPNASSYNVSMNQISSNTYYHNSSTIFSNSGDYSYYIWAIDINGNQSTSKVFDFSMPPNWDIDKDGQCTLLDLLLVSNHISETGEDGWIREDVDNNGIIDILDLLIVNAHHNEIW